MDDDTEIVDPAEVDDIDPTEIVIDETEPTAASAPDLDPEIEEEIKRALVPEELEENEDTPKAKTHQVPQDLIDKELSPDDLFDPGSI